MVYIKLVDGSDTVVAVEALETPDFVRWQEKNRLVESCSRLRAQGIVSKSGEHIYQLDGRNQMPEGATKTGVTAKVIAEADYEMLVLQLDEPEPEPQDEPLQESETQVMTIEQMRFRITELEASSTAKDERITELEMSSAVKDERIEFLEDCLLEMSEVVYADD